ncbi:Retrovirus-related Pol polyprotein from transposon TNT 1-94 [Cucumis melo var. makuwa]|uniref:Retrovirus-related Pol polyprotein from transposon TNT 1-94 n=1 Tax=Cucumis melo var. makuwa TaxID=1194695 RepID=A0A5D3E303_CUCMM|nr:Retrovirus-related Pol polyprotein from transposon TNT 1-94 [Cucumis melo var. makuwa]
MTSGKSVCPGVFSFNVILCVKNTLISCSLWIVLKQERKLYVLDEALFDKEPGVGVTKAQKDTYNKHYKDCIDVTCLMLACMNSELHKQFEKMDAFTIISQLKTMFEEQARRERFNTIKTFVNCKLARCSVLCMSISTSKRRGMVIAYEMLSMSFVLGMMKKRRNIANHEKNACKKYNNEKCLAINITKGNATSTSKEIRQKTRMVVGVDMK